MNKGRICIVLFLFVPQQQKQNDPTLNKINNKTQSSTTPCRYEQIFCRCSCSNNNNKFVGLNDNQITYMMPSRTSNGICFVDCGTTNNNTIVDTKKTNTRNTIVDQWHNNNTTLHYDYILRNYFETHIHPFALFWFCYQTKEKRPKRWLHYEYVLKNTMIPISIPSHLFVLSQTKQIRPKRWKYQENDKFKMAYLYLYSILTTIISTENFDFVIVCPLLFVGCCDEVPPNDVIFSIGSVHFLFYFPLWFSVGNHCLSSVPFYWWSVYHDDATMDNKSNVWIVVEEVYYQSGV